MRERWDSLISNLDAAFDEVAQPALRRQAVSSETWATFWRAGRQALSRPRGQGFGPRPCRGWTALFRSRLCADGGSAQKGQGTLMM
jgi:hypothetical protein